MTYKSQKNSGFSRGGPLRIGRGNAAVVAAAIVGFGMASSADAVISDVTSITTQLDAGTPSTVANVAGEGTSYSAFQSTSTYNETFDGDIQKVITATANGVTYRATGLATNVFRRSVGPAQDQLWYKGTGSGTSSTLTFNGPTVNGFDQIFDGNNILVGADNMFSNQGNPVGNNTNVDRVDLIFQNGITATPLSAFSILDRGDAGDHDAFKVAAITSVDANGTPTSYGTLISFGDGTYGKTNVLAPSEELIVRKDDNVNGTLHPTDSVVQGIGGIMLPTSDLAPAGTTIYGYSIFSADVDGSGNALVNFNNTNVYKAADYTSSGGGIDPAATAAVLYTTTAPVPEPTMLGLGALALGGMAIRRSRRATV